MSYSEASVLRRLAEIIATLRKTMFEKPLVKLYRNLYKHDLGEFQSLEELLISHFKNIRELRLPEDSFINFFKKVSNNIHALQITIQESLSISSLYLISLTSLLIVLVVLLTWLM